MTSFFLIFSPHFQNKLLKNFSNQLLLKHQCLKQLEDEEEYAAVPLEKVRSDLDQLISFEQFLNVTGLEAKSSKVNVIKDEILYLLSFHQWSLSPPSPPFQLPCSHTVVIALPSSSN